MGFWLGCHWINKFVKKRLLSSIDPFHPWTCMFLSFQFLSSFPFSHYLFIYNTILVLGVKHNDSIYAYITISAWNKSKLAFITTNSHKIFSRELLRFTLLATFKYETHYYLLYSSCCALYPQGLLYSCLYLSPLF